MRSAMRYRWAFVCALAIGCSSPSQTANPESDAAEAGGGDDAAVDDGSAEDAAMTSSPDAPSPMNPTCGDGVCAGNSGELCSTCATDCAKQTVTCGNGQCE